MTTGVRPADDLPDLLDVLADEFRDGGLAVEVVRAPGPVPVQLVVVADSSPGRTLRVSVYFLPDVADPPVVQCFAPLPYAVALGAEASLARFLCAVNAALPATGFEYSERQGVVAFRSTAAVGVRPLDPGVVAWALSMAVAAVREVGGLVEEVAGGLDHDEALRRLDVLLQRLYAD